MHFGYVFEAWINARIPAYFLIDFLVSFNPVTVAILD